MGVWSPMHDNRVVFQEGALKLRVQLDIETGGVSTEGDGAYDIIAENSAPAYGEYSNGQLVLTMTFPVGDGDGTLTMALDPDEHPPLPGLSVDQQLECTDVGGWMTDEDVITSTDPDGDLVDSTIIVDDSFVLEGYIIPFGFHDFSVHSEDERLAAKISATEALDIVDSTPPELICPDPADIECVAIGGTPVGDSQVQEFLMELIATDVCDDSPDVQDDALLFFGLGDTEVTFTVLDDFYNDEDCTSTLTVVDTTLPEIFCPDPILIECNEFNGVGIDDPQIQAFLNAVAAVRAVDVCDDSLVLEDHAPLLFGLGDTVVTFTATDGSDNQAQCQSTVTVEDTTPPVITVGASPNSLWPPNHKLETVNVDVVVTDICDPNPTFVLQSASSDEPDNGLGDGDRANDIQGATLGAPDASVRLRRERSGPGDGRVYTLEYLASDLSTNEAEAQDTVVVDH